MNPLTLLKSSLKDGHSLRLFRINDYVDTDPTYAISVAMVHPLGSKNNLKDLPAIYELLLLATFKEDIENLRNSNTKFYFVMDISNFPYIWCCISTEEKKFVNSNDKFDLDTKALWDNYNPKFIITIVVNIHTPHTALKHIPFE